MLILVTDIFGLSSPLVQFANSITDQFTIVDPYSGQVHAFQNETYAYEYFTEHVGIENFAQSVFSAYKQLCQQGHETINILGFSAGASAVWMLNDKTKFANMPKIKHFIGYYGAQIRHLSELTPRFVTELIFPQQEPHFDVEILINTLSKKSNVKVSTVPFDHGFMNPHSVNFNSSAQQTHIEYIRATL